MQLRDEGKLALDDPAVAFFPSSKPRRARSARSRASRSAGCSRTSRACRASRPGHELVGGRSTRTTPAARSRARRDRDRVSGCTRSGSTRTSPTSCSERSSSRVSGTPYPAVHPSKLLRPLGMTATSLDPLPARFVRGARRLRAALPLGRARARAAGGERLRRRGWSLVVRRGSRALALCQLADDPKVDRQGDAEEMHKARYLTDEAWTSAWCIGWYARRREDVVWIDALGRLLRLHHERVLRAEGEGRRDRARERDRQRDRARAAARDDRA